MPAISVSPNQGKLLQILAQLVDARSILEIGTLGGYSTIWLARGLRAGGRLITLIVIDNVVRGGAVIDADSTDPSVQGVRRFVEMLGAEAGASGTAIQTVGIKGHDGFAIVLVDPAT